MIGVLQLCSCDTLLCGTGLGVGMNPRLLDYLTNQIDIQALNSSSQRIELYKETLRKFRQSCVGHDGSLDEKALAKFADELREIATHIETSYSGEARNTDTQRKGSLDTL